MNSPSVAELADVLHSAGNAHHDYESNFLKGERDEHWAGWYAAFTVGSMGDFISPSMLTELLLNVPASDDWFLAAAELIHSNFQS